MVSIISTHPIDIRYNKWEFNPEAHTKRRIWDCLIFGGAGVMDKRKLITPEGVVTEITDEALETLMTIEAFKRDMDNGFIKVLKNRRAMSVDPDEEARKDMNTDGSGKQITSADLEADGAEVNDDGSIDVTKGGSKAVARKAEERKSSSKKKRR